MWVPYSGPARMGLDQMTKASFFCFFSSSANESEVAEHVISGLPEWKMISFGG